MTVDQKINAVLSDDFANVAGDVEAPCGHWTYSEVEGTVYAVRTDYLGFKYLAEFESWADADGHRSEVEEAEGAWYLSADELEVSEDEAPAGMDFSDLS